MGQINASAEAVRQLANDLRQTVKTLEAISAQVKKAGTVSGWDDNQGKQFEAVVKRISNLTKSPVSTLEAAIPRLNKMAATLDKYNSIKF